MKAHQQARAAALSPGQRSALLDAELRRLTGQWSRVEERSDSQVVVITGRAVNHVMHLVLTMLSATLWMPVWLGVSLLGGERRTRITVDEYGAIDHDQEPLALGRIAAVSAAGAGWLAMVLLLFTDALTI